MSDLQQTARQTKALVRKKRNTAAMRRLRKTKSYLHRPAPTPERVRARTKTERFEVDQARDWVVVRAMQNRASECAGLARQKGLPVFEARQEERLVAENGKARVAQVPVLRRLLFVGISPNDERGALYHNQQVEALWTTSAEGLAWTPREWMDGASPVRIGPLAMQKFADHITGHRRDDKLVGDLLQALFAIGDRVTIRDGAFVTYDGRVEATDPSKGRCKVAITVFGRETMVEIDEKALEAA